MAEGKVVVVLGVETAQRLCDRFPDALSRIASDEQNEFQVALRSALQAEQEESREYTKIATLADRSSWRSATCSAPEVIDSLEVPPNWQATDIRIQTRTTTKQGDWTVISPWVDLDEGDA